MGIDYDMNLYSRLAEGIEQASPKTWRVTLREGLQFHDGTAVTAQAVVDAIAPISQEGHPSANALTALVLDLAGMAAEGARLVVFETKALNAAFPWSLSEPGVAVNNLPGVSDQCHRALHLPRSDCGSAIPRRSEPADPPCRVFGDRPSGHR